MGVKRRNREHDSAKGPYKLRVRPDSIVFGVPFDKLRTGIGGSKAVSRES